MTFVNREIGKLRAVLVITGHWLICAGVLWLALVALALGTAAVCIVLMFLIGLAAVFGPFALLAPGNLDAARHGLWRGLNRGRP